LGPRAFRWAISTREQARGMRTASLSRIVVAKQAKRVAPRLANQKPSQLNAALNQVCFYNRRSSLKAHQNQMYQVARNKNQNKAIRFINSAGKQFLVPELWWLSACEVNGMLPA
jgi:hypothetical protein